MPFTLWDWVKHKINKLRNFYIQLVLWALFRPDTIFSTEFHGSLLKYPSDLSVKNRSVEKFATSSLNHALYMQDRRVSKTNPFLQTFTSQKMMSGHVPNHTLHMKREIWE